MKKIGIIEGSILLFKTITEKLTHPDYATTVELASEYKIYTTGEGAEKKLIQFTPRESEEVFKQRVRLTQITTPDIVGSCTKPMYKVGRTPALKQIKLEGKDSDTKKKELEETAANFYGNQSVEQYLASRMVELDATDPNSFIVVEFTTPEGDAEVRPDNPDSKAMPYPFEVSSEEAVNFQYKNNVLQFLIVRNHITVKDDKNKDQAAFKYTLYLSNDGLVATQIHKTKVQEFKALNPNAVTIKPDDFLSNPQELQVGAVYILETKDKGQDKYFIVTKFEHKIGFVPAQRVGCVRDLTTRGRTRVPLIHQAKAYLEKAIKTISEFDLTNCLHVFPQKIQYSEACAGYDGDDDKILIPCNRGLSPDGSKCKSCNGSGFKVHKSASDLIQIAMPRDPRDMTSLENFLVYKHPPTELLEFQKQLGLYELRRLAQSAVYNSDVFSKETLAKTATEEKIDLDAVYDTLKPFADGFSDMYVFIYKCIAMLRDIPYEEIHHKFPTDFKMKSTMDLLNELKLANENQASSHVKEAITRDIVRKYYADNPYEILRMETKEKYIPFSGKSDTQIALIMASDTTTEESKILYSNFDEIFSELEYENKSETIKDGFYGLEEKKQRELIKEKVKEFIDKIKTQPVQLFSSESD